MATIMGIGHGDAMEVPPGVQIVHFASRAAVLELAKQRCFWQGPDWLREMYCHAYTDLELQQLRRHWRTRG